MRRTKIPFVTTTVLLACTTYLTFYHASRKSVYQVLPPFEDANDATMINNDESSSSSSNRIMSAGGGGGGSTNHVRSLRQSMTTTSGLGEEDNTTTSDQVPENDAATQSMPEGKQQTPSASTSTTTEKTSISPPVVMNPKSHHQEGNSGSEGGGVGACLVVKDDNHWLVEWLAFHYHVMPLRHLVVVTDPKSKTSPLSILRRWTDTHLMTIDVWKDEDFMPKSPPESMLKRYGNNTNLRDHIVRQGTLYTKCLEHFKRTRLGVSWVYLTDTDEFTSLNYNHKPESKKLHSSKATTAQKLIQQYPIQKPGSVLAFLRDHQQQTSQIQKCLYLNRYMVGNTESSPQMVHKYDATTPNMPDANNFLTQRFLKRRPKHGAYGKNMIHLDAMMHSEDIKARPNVHRVSEHCPNKDSSLKLESSKWVKINHYIGTPEQFFYRTDPRAIPGFGNAANTQRDSSHYDHLGEGATQVDTSSQGWIQGFIEDVGIELAQTLLAGVGQVDGWKPHHKETGPSSFLSPSNHTPTSIGDTRLESPVMNQKSHRSTPAAPTHTTSDADIPTGTTKITDEPIDQRNDYIGCYQDKKEHRAMPPTQGTLIYDISIPDCRSYCGKKGYKYAGLQNGRECFCGNKYDQHGSRPENECNIACATGSGICGGSYRMDVFWSKPQIIQNQVKEEEEQRHAPTTSTVEKNAQQSAPDIRSPTIVMATDSASYNFTTAICTIMKDAEAYFEEWIDYHLLGMEFDNIYIYDNSLDFDLRHWYQNTREHNVYSRVQIIHYPTKGQQERPMSECIRKFGQNENGPNHDYIAHIDADEFFVIPGYPTTYTNIKGILQDYLVPFGGALTVNWMMVGTNHKSVYSPFPVTKRFQYREEEPNVVIKTIVKSSDFEGMRNPHSAFLRNGTFAHTTLRPGNKLKTSSRSQGADPNPATNILLLYHYRYTSQKEYVSKRCVRGAILGGTSCTKDGKLKFKTNGPEHLQPHPGTVYDSKPWHFLTSKVPKYKMYEQSRDFH